MGKCGYCGSRIIMGGARSDGQVFCNNKCLNNAYLLSVSQQVPADVLDRQIEEVFRGNCPRCNQPGPIDVHKVHQVWFRRAAHPLEHPPASVLPSLRNQKPDWRSTFFTGMWLVGISMGIDSYTSSNYPQCCGNLRRAGLIPAVP